MMALGDAVRVTVVTDRTPNEINCASGYTAEELCTYLCKKYKIPPLTRTLFALRIKGSNYFLQDNYEVLRGSKDYELRIRYKIPRLEHLSSSDERTYDYYYQQARNDVNENKIPEVKYPEHKKELLGLGIADMCRALLDNVPLNEVKKNYKKYVPKIILKQHGPFPKKYAYKYLPEFLKKRENFNVLGIKNEYLRQLYELAPNYLSEEYEGLCWKVGSESRPVRVQVAPFHADQPGIRLYNTQDREWIPICKMEELIYLTRNDNCCLEVSRRGTPIFLNFKCEKQLSSFISVCDGYYRLMVKWTFNLSYKDETPSLRELHRMKCHGPVGGAFSYRKLEERRGKKHGCYILRQCQEEYNAFYIDVCTKNCTTESYKLEFIGHAYIFNKEEYGSVERLVASHQNPEGRIYLSECIPPSEYDKSQLLLCGQQKKFGVRIDQGELQEILKDNKSPRCLSTKDILLYTGKAGTLKPIYQNEIDDVGVLLQQAQLNFSYYSVSGTMAMWEFPFCDDEYICEEHTTFLPTPLLLWPLRQKHMNYDLELSVRSFHSALLFFMCDAYNDYPRVTVKIGFPNNVTEVLYQGTEKSKSELLGDVKYRNLIGYESWTHLHLTIFAQDMQITRDLDGHLETVLKIRHEVMPSLRWYAAGADNSITHWAFYCSPQPVLPAYPPECTLSTNDFGYNGTQSVSSSGLPCAPWNDKQLIPREYHEDSLFVGGVDSNVNFCRNINKKDSGPWCFVVTPDTVVPQACHVRRCSAMDCKVAGTANDYAGQMSVTRSGRKCDKWIKGHNIPDITIDLRNGTLYPESSVDKAENFCRNPTRSLAGAWCLTTDEALERDLCDVRDCLHDETHIVMTKHGGDLRYIYILPEWKYTGSEKIGASGTMATHKALWKLDETKKLEVAFKSLQRDKAADNLKDFIDLASKWACISSNCIVRLYGITLCSPTAMVLEFLPYGPFDVYLRRNKRHIKPLHLKKIAASLARALWDLSEAGIVHGYIRCRRLLVASSDEERITVKLSGPSLHTYTNEDVHWIPVEYLSDMSLVRRQVAGDIWAFATTLWEMFSFGHSPNDLNPVLTAKSYENGTRLHRPDACPSEVWELVRSCWHADPHLRVRPQELMRDMNYMLHSEYVPLHKYEKIQLTFKEGDAEHDTVSSDRLTNEMSETGSNKSLISVNSSNPSLDDTLSDHFSAGNKSSESLDSLSMACPLSGKLSRSHSRAFSGFSLARPHSPDAVDAAPLLMETILSQGATYLVTMINKIGSGNYGTVYKGWMEQDNREKQTGREVAVKTLNRQERNGSVYADFKNEFEIMKSLVHENIVEILGYSWDHDSQVLIVMEYMEQGSLSQYLHSCGDKLKIWHLLKYALDIATGMDHISAKNIVHRDLAARNILVVNKHHVKISDFGLARIIPKEESSYTVKSERYLPFNWYAPESTQEKFLFSTKSDVWSYGVTCWEIFNLCKKEVPKFDIQNPTKRASVFTKPEGCPQEVYRRLLESCWQLDPSRRPSFINLVHLCKSVIIEYK